MGSVVGEIFTRKRLSAEPRVGGNIVSRILLLLLLCAHNVHTRFFSRFSSVYYLNTAVVNDDVSTIILFSRGIVFVEFTVCDFVGFVRSLYYYYYLVNSVLNIFIFYFLQPYVFNNVVIYLGIYQNGWLFFFRHFKRANAHFEVFFLNARTI